jgi:very-long-chain (3R)-3-hydroxyacyl-CoA dehydratase
MTAFESIGVQLMICQLVAFLEVVHPLLGLVKTGVVAPLAQVSFLTFRFLLRVCMYSEPRI